MSVTSMVPGRDLWRAGGEASADVRGVHCWLLYSRARARSRARASARSCARARTRARLCHARDGCRKQVRQRLGRLEHLLSLFLSKAAQLSLGVSIVEALHFSNTFPLFQLRRASIAFIRGYTLHGPKK